jgi:hypothetical protein
MCWPHYRFRNSGNDRRPVQGARETGLLAHHVGAVPFVLVADVLHHLLILRETGRLPDDPGLLKGFRILKRQLNFEVTQIRPPVALDCVQFL